MAKTAFIATGRRKKSVARVRLVAGDGKITINRRDIDNYFGLETLKMTVRQPLALTGNKLADKTHVHHTGYPGGLKEITYGELLSKKPEFAVYESIRRMMPKGPLGRKMLKKLRVYAGPTHNHEAQQPEALVLK